MCTMDNPFTDQRTKKERVKKAKKLLKLYPEFNKKRFADFITGDETWVHFSSQNESVRIVYG